MLTATSLTPKALSRLGTLFRCSGWTGKHFPINGELPLTRHQLPISLTVEAFKQFGHACSGAVLEEIFEYSAADDP